MTREIKFRGRRTDNREWVYGEYCRPILSDSLRIHYGLECCLGEETPCIFCDEGNVPIIPETLGQYVGFRDQNGKEIYEGDKVTLKGAVSATVEWNNFGFHLYGLEDVNDRRPDYAFSDFNQIEVIGNIHTRKEEPK